jgi:hypothetical protein
VRVSGGINIRQDRNNRLAALECLTNDSMFGIDRGKAAMSANLAGKQKNFKNLSNPIYFMQSTRYKNEFALQAIYEMSLKHGQLPVPTAKDTI